MKDRRVLARYKGEHIVMELSKGICMDRRSSLERYSYEIRIKDDGHDICNPALFFDEKAAGQYALTVILSEGLTEVEL